MPYFFNQTQTWGTGSKVYEIDKQLAELNVHLLILAQNHSKGWLDAVEHAEKSAAVSREVAALRASRRKLLAEDENDELLDDLRGLNDVLAQAGPQTQFDEDLFGQLITGITAVSPTLLRFRPPSGLELDEKILRTERRVSA